MHRFVKIFLFHRICLHNLCTYTSELKNNYFLSNHLKWEYVHYKCLNVSTSSSLSVVLLFSKSPLWLIQTFPQVVAPLRVSPHALCSSAHFHRPSAVKDGLLLPRASSPGWQLCCGAHQKLSTRRTSSKPNPACMLRLLVCVCDVAECVSLCLKLQLSWAGW